MTPYARRRRPVSPRVREGRRECSSSDRVAHSPPTRCRTRRGALDGPTRRNGHGYPPDAVTTRARTPPSVVPAGQTGRRHVFVTKNQWVVRVVERRSGGTPAVRGGAPGAGTAGRSPLAPGTVGAGATWPSPTRPDRDRTRSDRSGDRSARPCRRSAVDDLPRDGRGRAGPDGGPEPGTCTVTTGRRAGRGPGRQPEPGHGGTGRARGGAPRPDPDCAGHGPIQDLNGWWPDHREDHVDNPSRRDRGRRHTDR